MCRTNGLPIYIKAYIKKLTLSHLFHRIARKMFEANIKRMHILLASESMD